MKRFVNFVLFQLLILILNYNFVNADLPQIYISEIFWTGSNVSTADEWIELYNPSSTNVNIDNWVLTKINKNDDVYFEEAMVTLGGTIAGNSVFLISNNTQEHIFSNGQSALNVVPNIVDSSISFSNSNLQIRLYKSNSLGSENLVDTAGNGNSPLAGDNNLKSSMSRKLPVQNGTLVSSWYGANYSLGFDDQNHFGTPGSKNISRPEIISANCDKELFVYSVNNELNCQILAESYEQSPINIIAEVNNNIYNLLLTGGNWQFNQTIFASFTELPIIFRVSDSNRLTSEKVISFGTYNLSNKLIITEVYPNPNENENEWIEIYNQGTQPVNLKYWKIDDVLNGGATEYIIEGDIFVNPEQFLIFEKSETGIGLNNSGDEVNLIDPQENIMDKTSWENTEKGQSFARINEKSFVWTQFISKGAKNIFPITDYKNTKLEISEIMPNPDGADEGNEWIEIYNNSDQAIDLSNWSIDDQEGDSSPYTFEKNTVLQAREYLVTSSQISSIELKNIQDKARLLSPDGNVFEYISYFAAKNGESFAKENNKWYWTQTPTPGIANKIVFDDITLPNIEKAENQEIEQNQGIVLEEKNNLSASLPENISLPQVLGIAIENVGLGLQLSKLTFEPIMKTIFSTRNNKKLHQNYLIWIILNGIIFYSLTILLWKKTKLSEALHNLKNSLRPWHPG